MEKTLPIFLLCITFLCIIGPGLGRTHAPLPFPSLKNPCPFEEGEFAEKYQHLANTTTDSEFVDSLYEAPNCPILRRIAVVSRMYWFINYRLANCYQNFSTKCDPAPGKWLTAHIEKNNEKYFVVHWEDIDDDSASVYFKGDTICATVYEN